MPASSLQTLVALAAVADAFSPAAAQTKPRHLVLIVADDLGYADLGYTGSEILTPHIDGLARSGVDMRMHIHLHVRRGAAAAVRGARGARAPRRAGGACGVPVPASVRLRAVRASTGRPAPWRHACQASYTAPRILPRTVAPYTRGGVPEAIHQRQYAAHRGTPQANSGVKLGHFYVQRACSPTRAALLTGRYNIRYPNPTLTLTLTLMLTLTLILTLTPP